MFLAGRGGKRRKKPTVHYNLSPIETEGSDEAEQHVHKSVDGILPVIFVHSRSFVR